MSLQSVTVAIDAAEADPMTGSSAERTEPAGRWPRSRVYRILARTVLVVALLLTALGLSVVIACFISDRIIAQSRGTAVAEVVDTSLTRTVVRFSTDNGRVYIPSNGVLYPTGLQERQAVRVEFDQRNPDLVRVADRNVLVSLLPVSSSLAGAWAVLGPGYWLLRRASRR